MNKTKNILKNILFNEISLHNVTQNIVIKARHQYWDFFFATFSNVFFNRVEVFRRNKLKVTNPRGVECSFNQCKKTIDYIDRNDSEFITAANEWIVVQQQIKDLQEKEKNIKTELINMTDKKSSRWGLFQISEINRRGNIDYSKIPELKNVDMEKYRKKHTTFWKISYELDKHRISNTVL